MSYLSKGLLIAATVAAVPGASVGPAASAPTTSSTSGTEALQEVTVTAKHIQLEQRVSTFVYQIAALENAEGLPRWRKGVCPQVTGLARDEGEFILGRISEIARAAAVPLAGDTAARISSSS